jgi:hypothetical protein
MPVFDAITTGYVIKTHTDIHIKVVDGLHNIEWANDTSKTVTFHPPFQVVNYKNQDLPHGLPKLRNPWGIKTPKGYSVLVTQPMHRDLPFTIFPGVVDTDKYVVPINFPFTTNDPNFEGLIPKGTPIAQIIPFKREKWKYKIGNKKEEQEAFRSLNLMGHKFFDKYKNMYWNKKEFL